MTNSHKFQQALDEINAKAAAKLSTKVWNATKKGASKVASGSKEAVKRAGITAQNAIVAGAAAPLGAKLADSYNKPHKRKEHKYSASDVAAISAATRKNEDLNEDSLASKIQANLADFAKAESEAYLKAKAVIDKAQKEQFSASNANALKHPILSAIKDGIRVSGHIFLAILLGLAFIALYSRHSGSAKQLFKLVLENVSQNIINDALVIIGFTAGYRKIVQMITKDRSVSESLLIRKSLLEEQTKKKSSDLKNAAKTVAGSTAAGAGVGGTLGAGMAGGLAHKAARTVGLTQRRGLGKAVRRGITGLAGVAGGTYGVASGALKGLVGGAALAGAGYAIKKAKDAKEKKKALKEAIDELKSFTEARSKTKPYAQTLKKHMKGVGEVKQAKKAAQAAKALSKGAKAKEVINGSAAFKKALDRAAFKGGLKGAALTAGLGAAAYGVHKIRKNNEYNY